MSRKVCFFSLIVIVLVRVSLADGHPVLEVFRESCIKCHGQDGEVKGKVDLLKIDSVEALRGNPELLEELIDVIDFEEMPPEDEPQLAEAGRGEFLRQLKALRESSLSYPRTPIRRMNRFQYNNAVVDLFELRGVVFSLPERMMREHRDYFKPHTGKMAEVVTVGSRPLGKSQMIEPRLAGVAPFPQDLRAEHGFDNRGDHLSMSPLLMESFLRLGQSVVGSKDFNQRNVGIWKKFFMPPGGGGGESLKEVVRFRMTHFLKRAFRRPADEDVLERYVGFVESQLDDGVAFAVAMKSVAAAVISSPRFLYLYDGEGDGKIDDFEVASRLSFFLWGSQPDGELLRLATNGRLSEAEILDRQLGRMLKDQKLKRFCDSFPSQWLQLERIISAAPSAERFPGFYFSKYRDSMHMMLEPLLVFETVLIEDLPITQLIDSDFTYRSHLLEKAYGELALATPRNGRRPKRAGNDVTILNFRRIPVTDRRSGGVITNAAVMAMTSGPERTQPITRGAWLAGVIFNNPPEPPPADVPALGEEPSAEEEHLTLRERLLAHRQRADCKGCHEQIDPLGFALENFDPIGRWRTKYENGRSVDMAGVLFRKHEFGDVVEFKDAILAEKDRFARGLAGHLLSFALARELGPADEVALDEIAARTAADGYRMQALLKHVILSEPFLSKSNPKQN